MRKVAVVSCAMVVLLGLYVPQLPAQVTEEPAEELSVFSAAGAKPAMDEICGKFEAQTGIRVKISYAGGGEALSQMTISGSGDVYVAPEQRFMESAIEKKAIDPQTIRVLGYTIPVIAVRKGNPKHIAVLADLAAPGIRVAVARPETTLTGKYALEIFEKAGLAEPIGKNIITQPARPDQLLTMLILDQVDAGIVWHVYQTLASDKIEIIYLPPQHLPGVGKMQIARSLFSKDQESAQKLIDFAVSSEGKIIFERHGYIVAVEELKKYYPEL